MRMEMTNLLVLFGTTSPLFSPSISCILPPRTIFYPDRLQEMPSIRIRGYAQESTATLLFRRHVNAIGTTVHVKDGVVTISRRR